MLKCDLIWGFFHRFDDPEVQRDVKFLPYKVVNRHGKPYIQVKVKGEETVFSPEQISAMILGKMKETAEAFLGKTIKDAVITVPGSIHLRFFPPFFLNNLNSVVCLFMIFALPCTIEPSD